LPLTYDCYFNNRHNHVKTSDSQSSEYRAHTTDNSMQLNLIIQLIISLLIIIEIITLFLGIPLTMQSPVM